jgi:hypothetical protein
VSSSLSKFRLEAPPRIIRWTLSGVSCSVGYRWLRVPNGGSPGGGGGAVCPWAPHLSLGRGGDYGSNGAEFTVIGGRVLPATGVRVLVTLANRSHATFEPHDAMWMAIVQRCGDYEGTAIRSVKLLSADGSVVDEKTMKPEEIPTPNPWPTWPPC